MTYSDIAKFCKLPVRAVSELYRDGIFRHTPPDTIEMKALFLLSKIWRKEKFIKMQLAQFTKVKRKRLAECAKMTKPESYAYNRFLRQRIEKVNSGARSLTISEVAEELHFNYKIPLGRELFALVRRMRWRSYKIDISNALLSAEVRHIEKSKLE